MVQLRLEALYVSHIKIQPVKCPDIGGWLPGSFHQHFSSIVIAHWGDGNLEVKKRQYESTYKFVSFCGRLMDNKLEKLYNHVTDAILYIQKSIYIEVKHDRNAYLKPFSAVISFCLRRNCYFSTCH